MDKHLWRFCWDCGRDGRIEGLFVASKEDVKNIIGKEIYFGEVLGKHSEVYGTMKEEEITEIIISRETIEEVTEVLGNTWCGYNPLKYISWEGEQ